VADRVLTWARKEAGAELGPRPFELGHANRLAEAIRRTVRVCEDTKFVAQWGCHDGSTGEIEADFSRDPSVVADLEPPGGNVLVGRIEIRNILRQNGA
jgi:hypothetical protein